MTNTTNTASARAYREQAEAIARLATALAEGSLQGPRHAAVARLRGMVETLAAWTSDDRSTPVFVGGVLAYGDVLEDAVTRAECHNCGLDIEVWEDEGSGDCDWFDRGGNGRCPSGERHVPH